MRELANRCGVSDRTISAWESGATVPQVEARRKLADVLELPYGFFERDDPPQLAAEAVSFRALSAMTARERDQALAAGVMAFELDAWLSSRFAGPPVDIPELPEATAEAAAQQTRAYWQLGDQPIAKVIPLLEAHGVRVYSLVSGTKRLDAYATWANHLPYVFLNTEQTAERGRFDLCHELGHLVLHKGVQTVRHRAYELESERFAGAFLMPASGLYARAPRRVTLDLVMREKHYWGVPAMAYVYRVHELGLISDWHYRSYCIELTKRGYRKDEPDGQRPESSLLLAKVFNLLRRSQITMAQLVEELHVSENELSQLVFGLVLTGQQGGKHWTERRRNHLSLLQPESPTARLS